MRKIFFFELATAFKDRPRLFQVITLVLFAFSLTMVLIGTIARLTGTNNNNKQQVFQQEQGNHYINVASSTTVPVTPLQK